MGKEQKLKKKEKVIEEEYNKMFPFTWIYRERGDPIKLN